MANIYDDMIGKAADDILASAEVDKPKQYVWVLHYDNNIIDYGLRVFATSQDAKKAAYSYADYCIEKLEVE